jgi:hypothetical protein
VKNYITLTVLYRDGAYRAVSVETMSELVTEFMWTIVFSVRSKMPFDKITVCVEEYEEQKPGKAADTRRP